MTPLRKRILVSFSIFAVLLCIAVFFLIRSANEILKSQIEKSLGKDFSIEKIVLNWGSVDAYGIRLLKDGEEIARADSMSIRADFLSFLKKHYSVSGLTIEKPYLKITIDKKGNMSVPFMSGTGKKEGAAAKKSSTAFEVGRITVNNGQVFILDERLPAAHNTIAIKEFNLRLDNLSYPVADASSAIKLSGTSEGKILSGTVEAEGTIDIKTAALDIHVDGKNVVLLDLDKQGPIAKAESMEFSATSKENQDGKYFFVDKVVLKKPYLRIETDEKGDLVSPWKDVIQELQKAYSASGK